MNDQDLAGAIGGAVTSKGFRRLVDKHMGTPLTPTAEEIELPKDPRLITVGCIMTNQARKDWGLAAAICRGLVDRLPNIRFWWHVDTPIRHWSLPALIADYQLDAHVEMTHPPMDDAEMARRYRTCDLTILPSLGEGFGYPAFESFACGVPCLHGDYAGGASLMSSCGLGDYLIEPAMERLDTQHNCVRPVFAPEDWVRRAVELLQADDGLRLAVELPTHVQHLNWPKLAVPWRRWLREGLGDLK